MKKAFFSLLAAIMLVGSASAAQVQAQKTLTASEANEIIQKISGSWSVNMSVWCPEKKTITNSNGDSDFSTSYLDNYTHERYAISQPDGEMMEGETFLRYCNEKNRFEVVQMDNAGGGVVLMVGTWYPEHKTLVFRQVPGQENQVNKSDVGMQFRYVFLDDGTFSKMTHKLDKKKKYYLASVSHYGNPTAAKQ